jgi:YD repeat-containing protein
MMRANSTATNLPAAVQAAYDAANEQIQFGSATLTYDLNGNLTSDGTNTYTWDARNRLVGISGAVSASFTYDTKGRRVTKTINGVTTQFLYDGKDIIGETSGSSVAYLRLLNIDEPLVRQSMENEFYHSDALGSVLALSNSSGAGSAAYFYEPFGKTTITGNSSNSIQ